MVLVVVTVILHGGSCGCGCGGSSSNEEGSIGRSVYGREPLEVRQKRRWWWWIGLKGPPIETSKAAGRRHREVEVVVTAVRRRRNRNVVGNKREMLHLRRVVVVVAGDAEHCLRERIPQVDLAGESGVMMVPGCGRRQPKKTRPEVIHWCCLVEQNGLATVTTRRVLLMTCGTVVAADSAGEELRKGCVLGNGVSNAGRLIVVVVVLFLLLLGCSLPGSLSGLDSVDPNLGPRQRQPGSLACLGSTTASRFRHRKVLVLVLVLALIVNMLVTIIGVAVGVKLNRIKPMLAAGPLLIAELFRRLRERTVVQRRKLSYGISSSFDQPLHCFTWLVITQPILKIVELNGGCNRQPDPPVSQPFRSPHLAVPIFATGSSRNPDDSRVVPPVQPVAATGFGAASSLELSAVFFLIWVVGYTTTSAAISNSWELTGLRLNLLHLHSITFMPFSNQDSFKSSFNKTKPSLFELLSRDRNGFSS